MEQVLINFILRGGPPWGFRIKQRLNRVVVSKVRIILSSLLCQSRALHC